jgi:hypothetical protein
MPLCCASPPGPPTPRDGTARQPARPQDAFVARNCGRVSCKPDAYPTCVTAHPARLYLLRLALSGRRASFAARGFWRGGAAAAAVPCIAVSHVGAAQRRRLCCCPACAASMLRPMIMQWPGWPPAGCAQIGRRRGRPRLGRLQAALSSEAQRASGARSGNNHCVAVSVCICYCPCSVGCAGGPSGTRWAGRA